MTYTTFGIRMPVGKANIEVPVDEASETSNQGAWHMPMK